MTRLIVDGHQDPAMTAMLAGRDYRRKASVHLDTWVDAVDSIRQITGDALHVGIGTDFDGGQGAESAPAGIDTVADLSKLADGLARRGYDPAAIEAITSGNWLRVLRAHLPG